MPIYDHTWLIAEWKRMGKPVRETLDPSDGLWLELYEEDCDFFENALYRIKSKPSINWDHVSECVVAMATNSNGATEFYGRSPWVNIDIGRWLCSRFPLLGSADILSSFTQGTCDWKESLVMRPVVGNS
jgi:hypothetical protein